MPEFSAIDFESLFKEWIKGLINFAPTMLGAIALYFIGRYIIRFIVKLLKGLMQRRGVDLALQGFLLQVVRWILYIALFLTIVQHIESRCRQRNARQSIDSIVIDILAIKFSDIHEQPQRHVLVQRALMLQKNDVAVFHEETHIIANPREKCPIQGRQLYIREFYNFAEQTG